MTTTARTALSPALLVAALLIGAAISALLIGALGLGSATRPSGSEEWWPDSAGPANSATPRMPWTTSTSTPSPADALAMTTPPPGCNGTRLTEGMLCLMATGTPPPCFTALAKEGRPCRYEADYGPTATPAGTTGQVRIGER